MTKEDIKELIYNADLDYSNINIKDGRVKGYITVLVNDEEFKELSNIPYFYLDEFELDINRYYESAGLTLLNGGSPCEGTTRGKLKKNTSVSIVLWTYFF